MAIENIPKYCAKSSIILREVIENLDSLGKGVMLIVDEEGVLVGLLTDGDLRRYLLNKGLLEHPVSSAMNRAFTSWPEAMGRSTGTQFLKSKKLRHLPVVDDDGRPVDLLLADDKIEVIENPVIIMAGGKGMRLRPYTESCPKPMLELEGKPMLEHIILHFIEQGFHNFCIAVNYLSHVIENYFGDGTNFGVKISYLREGEPLGTGGALGLLEPIPSVPVVVCNGDVLTKANFRKMLQFHEENTSAASIGVRSYQMQVPFGVVESDEDGFHSIREKPIIPFQVNTGIYCISPELFGLIKRGTHLNMPDLLVKAKASGNRVSAFPVHEVWVDVGRPEELVAVRKKNPLTKSQ